MGAIDGIIDEVQLSSQMRLFIYGTFLYCTLNTAYNLVNIPYAALLPELTGDYNQRTSFRIPHELCCAGTFVEAALVMPPSICWISTTGSLGGNQQTKRGAEND